MSGLRTLSQVHAWVAWVAVAGVVAAMVGVWRRARWGGVALGGALILGAGAFATGALLHAPFQAKLRQRLFLASSALGWLFERKEHVAFGAMGLLGTAVLAMVAARAAKGRDALAAEALRRSAMVALGGVLVFEAFAIAVSVAAGKRVGF